MVTIAVKSYEGRLKATENGHRASTEIIAAIRSTEDQGFLKYAAIYGKNGTRIEAIKKITDEDFCKKRARMETDTFIMISAIDGVSDQMWLKDVLFNDKRPQAKMRAALRLTDEDLLEDIAVGRLWGLFVDMQRWDYNSLRVNAADAIRNERRCKHVAKYADYWHVRYIVVGKIRDKRFLEEVKETDPDYVVRSHAKRTLSALSAHKPDLQGLKRRYPDEAH